MADPRTPGDRLRDIREAARLSQREAAERMGVHFTTWNRYEQNKQKVPADILLRAQQALADVPREPIGVLHGAEERLARPGGALATPRFPDAYSTEARVLEAELLVEAAKAGLGDEEADAIRATLRTAGTALLYEGGRPRAMTDDEQLVELRALATGLRAWIPVRARHRRAARGGGAP